MLKVSVTADLSQLKRAFSHLSGKGTRAATSRALNKAGVNMRTDAIRVVREKRALKAKTIRDAFTIIKASAARLIVDLIARGRPIPLREYGATQTQRGVTVRVTKGAKRAVVVHQGNRAFAVQKYGDHVYAREGKARLPIKKLYGPSIPTALTNEAAQHAILRKGQTSFLARLKEELRFESRKAGFKT